MGRPEVTGRRILFHSDLKARGIPFSKQWINKLIGEGKFPPKNFVLGEQTKGWTEDVIDQYDEQKIERDDDVAVAQQLTEA